jgi:hypothetical protein
MRIAWSAGLACIREESRAMTAQLESRAADSRMWAALGAARTVQSAVTADIAAYSPERWATSVREAAWYTTNVLTLAPGGRSRKCTARIPARCAALVRQRLSGPHID